LPHLTRGVDVTATAGIRALINDLAGDGAAIMLVRRVVELPADVAQDTILGYMTGVPHPCRRFLKGTDGDYLPEHCSRRRKRP
jgi:hypothetical protein